MFRLLLFGVFSLGEPVRSCPEGGSAGSPAASGTSADTAAAADDVSVGAAFAIGFCRSAQDERFPDNAHFTGCGAPIAAGFVTRWAMALAHPSCVRGPVPAVPQPVRRWLTGHRPEPRSGAAQRYPRSLQLLTRARRLSRQPVTSALTDAAERASRSAVPRAPSAQ